MGEGQPEILILEISSGIQNLLLLSLESNLLSRPRLGRGFFFFFFFFFFLVATVFIVEDSATLNVEAS
jgi:hypothetical protein